MVRRWATKTVLSQAVYLGLLALACLTPLSYGEDPPADPAAQTAVPPQQTTPVANSAATKRKSKTAGTSASATAAKPIKGRVAIDFKPLLARRTAEAPYNELERELKGTKVGMDSVISRMVNHLKSYKLGESDLKLPLVVQMPGAQGTGKTTLVSDFVDLARVNDLFITKTYSVTGPQEFPMQEIITKLKENNARPPEKRGMVVVFLDETQHVTNWTGTKPDLWNLLGTGKIAKEFNPPKFSYVDGLAIWDASIQSNHDAIATAEQNKQRQIEQGRLAQGSSGGTYQTDVMKETDKLVAATDAQIATLKTQQEGFRIQPNNGVLHLLKNMVAKLGKESLQIPGLGNGTPESISKEFMKDPVKVQEKIREHVLGASSSLDKIDGRGLIIILASNPKAMDPVGTKFAELELDSQTHDNLNQLSQEMAPKELIDKEILAQWQNQQNPEEAWIRRLQLTLYDPLHPYSSAEFKENTRRDLERRYEIKVSGLLRDMKVPPQLIPKFVVPEAVIEKIYGQIKVDPRSGVQVYSEVLKTSLADTFDKLRDGLIGHMEKVYETSKGKSTGLPTEITLSLDGKGGSAHYTFTSSGTSTGGEKTTWVKAPAIFREEVKPSSGDSHADAVDFSEMRQAYTMAGHIVGGLVNFNSLPLGPTIPLEMTANTVSGGTTGGLYELNPTSSYAHIGAFAKMLLAGSIAPVEMLPQGDPLASQKANMVAAAKQLGRVVRGLQYYDNLLDPLTQQTSITAQKKAIEKRVAARKKHEEERIRKAEEEAARIALEKQKSEEEHRFELELLEARRKTAIAEQDLEKERRRSSSDDDYGGSYKSRSSSSSGLGYYGSSSRDKDKGDTVISAGQSLAPPSIPSDPTQTATEVDAQGQSSSSGSEGSTAAENVAKNINDQTLAILLMHEEMREQFAASYIESINEIQKHQGLVDAIAKEMVKYKVISHERLIELIKENGNEFSSEEKARILASNPGNIEISKMFELQKRMGLPEGHPEFPGAKKVVLEDPEFIEGTSEVSGKQVTEAQSSAGVNSVHGDGPLVKATHHILGMGANILSDCFLRKVETDLQGPPPAHSGD